MKRILTVIVTYNRKELLERAVRSVLDQSVTSDLFIFDNHSSDGTEEYLKQRGYLSNPGVIYYKSNENLGGAGGFHYGTVYGYKKNYDAVWLMDDDGYCLRSDTLEKLLKAAESIPEDRYLINSFVVRNKQLDLSWPFEKGCIEYSRVKALAEGNLIYGRCCLFNGTLISAACIRDIGYPLRKLFIYGDEREYLERAKENGIFMATCTDSLFFHPAKIKTDSFLGIPYIRHKLPIWGIYCEVRNQSYIVCRYKNHVRIRLLAKCLKYSFRTLAGDDKKIKRIAVIFRAAHDGAKGDFSANKEICRNISEGSV